MAWIEVAIGSSSDFALSDFAFLSLINHFWSFFHFALQLGTRAVGRAKPSSRKKIYQKVRINMIWWNMRPQHSARAIYAMRSHYQMAKTWTSGSQWIVSVLSFPFDQIATERNAFKREINIACYYSMRQPWIFSIK